MVKISPRFSRRTIVASLAIAPALSTSAAMAETTSPDAELIALGCQFDAVTAAIDDAFEGRAELTNELERLGSLEAARVARPAKTREGLCVKARAACWALLGDLEPAGETLDQRMGISIVRDLIRLSSPELEKPGALNDLVAQHS